MHPEDVQRLPLHVFGAHVHVALEAEERADRGTGDPVLPRAGLRDDSALSHALGQERLSERVVDLVRARVREIFTFEEDARPAERLRQTPRLVDRGRAADIMTQQVPERRAEGLVRPGREVRAFELLHRRDERFRHETSAVGTVVPPRVRIPLSERWIHE